MGIRIPGSVLVLIILVAIPIGLAAYVGFAVELVRMERENPWPRFQLVGRVMVSGGLLSGFGVVVGSLLAVPMLRIPVIIEAAVMLCMAGLGLMALVIIPMLVVAIVGLVVWVPVLIVRTYFQ